MILSIITLTVKENVQPYDALTHGLAVYGLGSIPIATVALVEVPSSRTLLSRFIQPEVTVGF